MMEAVWQLYIQRTKYVTINIARREYFAKILRQQARIKKAQRIPRYAVCHSEPRFLKENGVLTIVSTTSPTPPPAP
jgi:hypothetical protein